MNKRRLIIFLSLATAISAQDVVLTGQLWGLGVYGNDPAARHHNTTGLLGYIPTFSAAAGEAIDMEWALRLSVNSTGAYQSELESLTKQHRLWARYSVEKLEIRAGLQKMAFGPGMLLRPLAWYDTLDPRDPTGQTDGVEALRVRYFGGDNWSLAGWVNRLNDEFDMASGGRLELTTPSTEIGITFHYQAADTNLFTYQVAGFGRQRIAFDLRYDGFIGAWTEVVYGHGSSVDMSTDVLQIMIGGDYTLGIGQGIFLLNENLYSRDSNADIDPSAISMLMASISLGFIDQFTAIVLIDWDGQQAFNYLRWSRVYDSWSFNLMVGANPGRSGAEGPLSSFGESIQLMLIYNH